MKNHKATKPAFNVGHASETPLKWRFAGGRFAGGPMIYLDPLSPHQLKKNVVKVGPPLTKVPGSAHEL